MSLESVKIAGFRGKFTGEVAVAAQKWDGWGEIQASADPTHHFVLPATPDP